MIIEKSHLGDILTGEDVRKMIGDGLWREIDLPGHPGAALVVWRMEDDAKRSPKQELNARKLVAGFNVCERLESVEGFEYLGASYREAQQLAEAPESVMTPLQAAKEALRIAESHINDQLQGTNEYEPEMAKLEPVRMSILAAERTE